MHACNWPAKLESITLLLSPRVSIYFFVFVEEKSKMVEYGVRIFVGLLGSSEGNERMDGWVGLHVWSGVSAGGRLINDGIALSSSYSDRTDFVLVWEP